MSYHQEYQAKQYDKGSICGCGQPSRHASGKCWRCYDSIGKAERDKLLKEQLIKIDMWQLEGESRDEWNQRCKEYCVKKGYKNKSVGGV